MLIFLSIIQFLLIVATVVYLAINVYFLIQVEPEKGALADYPFVSVCVPARDEERDIEACLDSLLNQNYPEL